MSWGYVTANTNEYVSAPPAAAPTINIVDQILNKSVVTQIMYYDVQKHICSEKIFRLYNSW